MQLFSSNKALTDLYVEESDKKLQGLAEASLQKMQRLGGSGIGADQQQMLSDVVDQQIYTDPTSGQKYQQVRTKTGVIENVPYKGSTRSLYIDNTKTGEMKLGLAAGAGQEAFKTRYSVNPYYDGTPGPKGVTPEDGALMSVELPKAIADTAEYLVHTNPAMMANRAAGVGKVPKTTKDMYGPGYSEYYKADAPLFNQETIRTQNIPKNTYIMEEPVVRSKYAPTGAGVAMAQGSLNEHNELNPVNLLKQGAAGIVNVASSISKSPKKLYEFLGGDYLEGDSVYDKSVKTIINTMEQGGKLLDKLSENVIKPDQRNVNALKHKVSKAFDEGNYVSGVLGAAITHPAGAIELAANMYGFSKAMSAAGISSVPAIAGAFTDNADQAREIFKKEYNREPNNSELATIAALSAIGTAVDTAAAKIMFSKSGGEHAASLLSKAVDNLVSKVPNTVSKAALGASAKILGMMGTEGFQEALTEATTVLGGTQDLDKVTKPEYLKQVFEAGALGAISGPGMVATDVVIGAGKNIGKQVLSPENRQMMIDALRKKQKTAEQPAKTSAVWQTGLGENLDKHLSEGDNENFVNTLHQATAGLTNDQITTLLTEAQPYIKRYHQLMDQKAQQVNEGAAYEEVTKGAEPYDTIMDLITRVDDSKLDTFIESVRNDERLAKIHGPEELEQAIQDALVDREVLKQYTDIGIKSLGDVRSEVAMKGMDDTRKGYVEYYRNARLGIPNAKDDMLMFLTKHGEKAERMYSQIQQMNDDTLSHMVGPILDRVQTRDKSITEEDVLVAMLNANGKLDTVEDTTTLAGAMKVKKALLDEGLDPNKVLNVDRDAEEAYGINYGSEVGRNEGIFQVNADERLQALAVEMGLQDRFPIRTSKTNKTPSPVHEVLKATQREVEAMTSLYERLERKQPKAPKAKEEQPKGEPVNPKTKEWINETSQWTADNTSTELERVLNELYNKDVRSEVHARQKKAATYLGTGTNGRRVYQFTEKQESETRAEYMSRLAKMKQAAIDLQYKSNQEVQGYVKHLDKKLDEARKEETAEVEGLKKELAEAKDKAREVRKEMHMVWKAVQAQGKTLAKWDIQSKRPEMQALMDERNKLLDEVRKKEKGLRTSITVIGKVFTEEHKKEETGYATYKYVNELLATVYEHLTGTHLDTVISVVKTLERIMDILRKTNEKLGAKVGRFLNKLRNDLDQIQELKRAARAVERDIRMLNLEQMRETKQEVSKLEKELNSNTPSYSNRLIEYTAFGTEMVNAKVPEQAQKLLATSGRLTTGEIINIQEVVKTGTVNSDFARYDITTSEDSKLVEEVEEFAKLLEAMLPENEVGKSSTGGKSLEEMAYQDAGRLLVFNREGKIDRNVAGAMYAAILEELKNGSNYMNMTPQEVARMYGIEEEDLDAGTYAMLSEMGIPAKYVAAAMGKNIMGMLGMKPKDASVTREFAQLGTSLGNMAMYAAKKKGYIEVNPVANKQLAEIYNVAKEDEEKVGYYVKLGYGKITEVKKDFAKVNEKLTVPERSKGVRFTRKTFKEEECNGL